MPASSKPPSRSSPVAPIGHFRLTVFGGKSGYLINTRICRQAPVNELRFTGQSGKTLKKRVKVKTACKRTKKSKRRSSRNHIEKPAARVRRMQVVNAENLGGHAGLLALVGARTPSA